MHEPANDDFRLHALIDGQLEANERERLLAEISVDSDLQEQVCRLRRTKDLLNHAFQDAAPPARPRQAPGTQRGRGLAAGVAALLLLGVGFSAGWLTRPAEDPLQGVTLGQVQAQPHKVLLHIASDDPSSYASALDRAEALLKTRSDQGVEVELVANSDGLNLLRADVSPYAERIRRMMAEYEQLRFVACRSTIEKLEKAGFRVVLIEHTEVSTSAVEHIVDRLQQGWTYLKV